MVAASFQLAWYAGKLKTCRHSSHYLETDTKIAPVRLSG